MKYAVLACLYVLSFASLKEDTLWVFDAYGEESFVDS